MIRQWLGVFLLLAVLAGCTCCQSMRASAPGKSRKISGRAPQTGTNIPRTAFAEPPRRSKAIQQTAAGQKKVQRQQAAKEQADEEFVTRGGFR